MKNLISGISLSTFIALISVAISNLIPSHIISASVFALLIGIAINPYTSKYTLFKKGIDFSSKKLLRLSIILMGLTLSFSQVLSTSKFSLIVMVFTLAAAFLGGYILGKILGLDWKLSSLISAGTGICGGSAIAAIAPTIKAKDSDIAYAISATFIFDVLMVILFPILGNYLGMSDLGFGLWAGTAINDTSSVVAAGYAFSDVAGSYAVIVKLTRTLSIIPTVLIFSLIARKVEKKENGKLEKVSISKIFPYFILMFLAMVLVKSTGLIPDYITNEIGSISKFLMVVALASIGLKTNYKILLKSGFKPMFHGFIISTLVVIVSYVVQLFLGQV